MKQLVTGYKHSKGDFDGTPYDYVVVYSIARLKTSESQQGMAGIEMRGEPSLLEQLKKITFNAYRDNEEFKVPVHSGKLIYIFEPDFLQRSLNYKKHYFGKDEVNSFSDNSER